MWARVLSPKVMGSQTRSWSVGLSKRWLYLVGSTSLPLHYAHATEVTLSRFRQTATPLHFEVARAPACGGGPVSDGTPASRSQS